MLLCITDKCIEILCNFKGWFVCQGGQTSMADTPGLLHSGLCNKLDGLETAVT